jgi:hypothetical protein
MGLFTNPSSLINVTFPSALFPRHSTCPLCPQADLREMRRAYECDGYRFSAKHFAGQAGILRSAFELLGKLHNGNEPKTLLSFLFALTER